MKRAIRWFVVLGRVGLFLGFVTGSVFAANPHCTSIGGVILTNLGGFGTIDGSPTSLGVATGDLKGAVGVQILSANSDFTSINVQHHWVTENGDTLNIDPATARGVFVAQGLLAITEYKTHLSGGNGRFEKATGDMTNIGEVDFNTGQVVLRYSGTVCRQ